MRRKNHLPAIVIIILISCIIVSLPRRLTFAVDSLPSLHPFLPASFKHMYIITPKAPFFATAAAAAAVEKEEANDIISTKSTIPSPPPDPHEHILQEDHEHSIEELVEEGVQVGTKEKGRLCMC